MSPAVSYSPFLARERERGNVTFPALSRQAHPSLRAREEAAELQRCRNSYGVCAHPSAAPTWWISQQEQLCGSLDQPAFALFLQLHPHSWAGQCQRGKCFPPAAGSRDSGADVSLVSWAFMALLWLLEGPGTQTQTEKSQLLKLQRYCSTPLIKFLPSQDPQAAAGSPELVIQPLPRADKCHVMLENG